MNLSAIFIKEIEVDSSIIKKFYLLLFELIVLLLPIDDDDDDDCGIGSAQNVCVCNAGILWSKTNVVGVVVGMLLISTSISSPFVTLWLRLTLPRLDVVLLLTYPLDSVLKFKLVCDSSIL